MDVLTWDIVVMIGQVLLVDLVLAGDNAVVIGMAAGKLSADLQKKAIFWGTFGAIALRLVLAFVLVEALSLIPALHLVGGVILLWIAVKLLAGEESEKDIEAKDSLRDAIITIIVADAMMSIDNVLGVVGAARGNFEVILFGMLISVPIIIFSSTLFAKLIQKYPVILYLGAGILGWVAGDMILADDLVKPWVKDVGFFVKLGSVVIVFVLTYVVRALRRKKTVSEK